MIAINYLTSNKLWEQVKRWIPFILVLYLAFVIISQPAIVSAIAGFGGYISEKMLGDGTNEILNLGDGANELGVLGTAPIVSTVSATSKSEGGIVSADLTGNLQNLNGMPRASVWFAWGYTPAVSNSTPVNTVTTTGVQTATINPNPGDTVYYQFRASTDGIAYGSTKSFLAGGGHGVSYWMLNTLLPVVIAAVILISVLVLTGNPIAALLASVIGLIAFYIIQAMVGVL